MREVAVPRKAVLSDKTNELLHCLEVVAMPHSLFSRPQLLGCSNLLCSHAGQQLTGLARKRAAAGKLHACSVNHLARRADRAAPRPAAAVCLWRQRKQTSAPKRGRHHGSRVAHCTRMWRCTAVWHRGAEPAARGQQRLKAAGARRALGLGQVQHLPCSRGINISSKTVSGGHGGASAATCCWVVERCAQCVDQLCTCLV